MEYEKRIRTLTNEEISKRYRSQFDLVNHAIRLASHLIQSGYEPSPAVAENIVNDVLKDIETGRDAFAFMDEEDDEIEEEDVVEIEEEVIPAKKSRSRKEVVKR